MPPLTQRTVGLFTAMAALAATAGTLWILAWGRDAMDRDAEAHTAAGLLSVWVRDGGSPWSRAAAGESSDHTAAVMRQFYGGRSWRLAWLEHGHPTAQAVAVARLLASAAERGLQPADYRAALWPARLAAVSLGDARAQAQLDLELSEAVARFVSDLRFGRVDPRTLGIHNGRQPDAEVVPELLARLSGADDVDGVVRDFVEPPHPAYRRLQTELRRLRGQGNPADQGRIAQLELALERLRWLPRGVEGPIIVVNVPEFRLRAYGDSGDAELEMNVVVGNARDSATPLFSEQLREVVFQPAWYVPETIVRDELVPAEEREPGYLAAHGYEVIERDGRPTALALDQEVLADLRAGRLGLRQRPGPGNALGRVKFLFPNSHDVYLHDTPARAAFARDRRDLSHGCVRVADPQALARWTLRGVPGWNDERVAGALAGAETLSVALPRPIPVVIVYHTAVVDGEEVRFLPDLYGHDAALREAIAERRAPDEPDHQRRTRPVSTWTKSDAA